MQDLVDTIDSNVYSTISVESIAEAGDSNLIMKRGDFEELAEDLVDGVSLIARRGRRKVSNSLNKITDKVSETASYWDGGKYLNHDTKLAENDRIPKKDYTTRLELEYDPYTSTKLVDYKNVGVVKSILIR